MDIIRIGFETAIEQQLGKKGCRSMSAPQARPLHIDASYNNDWLDGKIFQSTRRPRRIQDRTKVIEEAFRVDGGGVGGVVPSVISTLDL